MRTCILVLLVTGFASAADRETAAVRLAKTASAAARPRLLFPQSRFELTARRPGGLAGVPTLTKAARFAVVRLGNRKLTLAFDAPEGAPALGLLHGGREGAGSAVGRARTMGKEGFSVDFDSADCGGLACNVRLFYRRQRVTGGVIEAAYHMRGKTVLAGIVREVVLIDADADGKWNGKQDRWLAMRADRARSIKTLSRPESLLLAEPQIPFEADGRALAVERVAEDGSGLVLVLDTPRLEMKAVLARRYREVRAEHYRAFERELVTFVEREQLDPKRTRTDRPAAWKSLPLSEAKALAGREGKPLLVCFFTESNPWSYRYEFYTFRDSEVDRLLRRFVLVRIDAEKDPEKSYQESRARAIPTLLPLTAAGKSVTFRLRTRKKDLKKEERMITGWQRPRELAVNLKRILKACSER